MVEAFQPSSISMLLLLLPSLALSPSVALAPPLRCGRGHPIAAHAPLKKTSPLLPLPLPLDSCERGAHAQAHSDHSQHAVHIGIALLVLITSTPASAASKANIVAGAYWAYGHYLSLILFASSLAVQRVLLQDEMTEREFDMLAVADGVYGLAGLGLTATGYLRVTQFGKGWDFYQHEPVFWLKMTIFSLMGAASFFPTTKIIQRSVAKRREPFLPPFSPALVRRMSSILNSQILAMISIPLTATLASRGVGYASDFPWELGGVWLHSFRLISAHSP